jgi:glyoxylase-like metal-dependent hydrolase (beta-lactamase superfamily II)
LHYPFAEEPATGDGSAVEVASGVFWLRMPLHTGLRWINVWAIQDNGSWVVVDTGLGTPETCGAWESAFHSLMHDQPVNRVIVTHLHPDHCGLAGWFSERFAAPLWMTRSEYLTCRVQASDSLHTQGDPARFYEQAGWDAVALQRFRENIGYYRRLVAPIPHAYRRIQDGDSFQIGAEEWRVVVGQGHSPEHACLYCPKLGVLVSGDQVLPRISSNVSVLPSEPHADPLQDWISSLRRIARQVPDEVLVLPAHNSPFRGLHARIEDLISHHERTLEHLTTALENRSRAVDLFPVLFSRPVTPATLTMATGETLAHLNHLAAKGRALCEIGGDGVAYWRRC